MNQTVKLVKFKNSHLLWIFIFSVCFGKHALAEEALTWGKCLEEAAKNHPDLIASSEEIKQSEAAKQQTASGLFPQVTANLSAQTTRANGKSTDAYGYGVSGTQLIFDGIKTINNLNAGFENITAAKQGFRYISATVRYRLRSAFIDLLKAQEMLRIAEEIYELRRGNLELILYAMNQA